MSKSHSNTIQEVLPAEKNTNSVACWHNRPISKQGAKDQMDPSQYGGITLLSVMYKAFCRILGSRLVGIIESEKLLSDEQNGFRKGRGCIDHVLALNLLNAIRMKAKETYSTSQK